MLDRAERSLRHVRRAVSRSGLTARLLGLPVDSARRDAPGLLIVQIDGLARERLLAAMRDGNAPFLRSLVERGTHAVTPVYTGLPSMTPAVQAELFYGERGAVASFSFVDHETGRVLRMYEAAAARAVEARLRGPRALLDGGASYLNIYDAGATHPRFCMASLGWGALGTSHPLAGAAVVLLHLPGALRAAGATIAETVRGAADLAMRRGDDLGTEVKFAQSRVLISVVLRELCAFGASVDLARGTPVVHVNLLGYDEYAHRRGPDSEPARRGMRPVDAAIRRLARRAERSAHRHYDVWVMSDHGQERTRPYAERNGRSVRDAVAEVFAEHDLHVAAHEEPELGEQRYRARALGARVIELVVPGLELQEKHRTPGSVLVVAQGSLGNVYAPRTLAPEERDTIAAALVTRAAIPLVCAADGPGRARAWTASGTFSLPEETAAIVGVDHPYLDAVAHDLVDLCHHHDAGDFVISGWHATDGVSFSKENGAHAGPGPQETDAFVLAPVDTPLPPPTAGVRRFGDLRRAAFRVLDGEDDRPVPPRARRAGTVRLLTYNVHGCVGMDDVLSLRRVARTIARHDPDVVALQELDVARARSGGVDQAQELARLLQMELQFHPTITVAEERFGDAVLSRLPMREVRSGLLPALGSDTLEPRGAIWVEVQTPSGRALQIVNTHLSLHPRERRLQIDELLGPTWLGDPRAARDVVLCGDFNAMAWFPSCRVIRRRLRDAQIGVDDRRPAGTWPGRMRLARIDHVFVDPALEIAHVEVADDVHARVASDHRPLIVDLVDHSAR